MQIRQRAAGGFVLRHVVAEHGATFKEGSNHTKVYPNGKQTTLPRHPSAELKEGTRRAILKQLGLK
ncbi:type II toxin-antitoxin system HicA family toxin [Paraburkholderia sp. BL17N1]|uniref:type II toxin-antitoxin system HicA family toxin n=1 Tax=Paraburkholderia sp. BL17N1 TaxID=1938798 RepID=UPI000EB5983E|nr:type II toxin-antitoxin system HicA family toxin [Paraburkholderia sp. BL17N1]RKR45897.1 mRNA interferase HicA [Paraburkholderia sp. BL17N1]